MITWHLSVFFCQILLLSFPVRGAECDGARPHAHGCTCREKNVGCQMMEGGVTCQDMKLILDIHNSLRQQVHPTAANMRLLEWDDELAAMAQSQANQCYSELNCTECRTTVRFSVGQNVLVTAEDNNNTASHWQTSVNKWWEQSKVFPSVLLDSFSPNHSYSAYSQMIWANTYKIGCGFSRFQLGEEHLKLYICNYGPSGNVIGQSVFNKGSPCSECPQATTCSKDYPGLCVSVEREIRDIGKDLQHVEKMTSERPHVLLSCGFERNDCKNKSIGSIHWKTVSDTSTGDNFFETSVPATGNAVLFLLRGIPPTQDGSACFSFRYRKFSKTASTSQVPLKVFSWSLMGPPIETLITEDAREWTPWKTTIHSLKGYTIIFFHVGAPAATVHNSDTYVSLGKIQVVASPCL